MNDDLTSADMERIKAQWRARWQDDFKRMGDTMARLLQFAYESQSAAIMNLCAETNYIVGQILGGTPDLDRINLAWHDKIIELFGQLRIEVAQFVDMAQAGGDDSMIRVSDEIQNEVCHLADTYLWRFILNGMAQDMCGDLRGDGPQS